MKPAKSKYIVDKLKFLKFEIRSILGNELCLPKVFLGLSASRQLSDEDIHRGEETIDRAIYRVNAEIDRLIDEMQDKD